MMTSPPPLAPAASAPVARRPLAFWVPFCTDENAIRNAISATASPFTSTFSSRIAAGWKSVTRVHVRDQDRLIRVPRFLEDVMIGDIDRCIHMGRFEPRSVEMVCHSCLLSFGQSHDVSGDRAL